MALLVNRAASGLVAGGYLVAAAISGGVSTTLMIAVFLLLPLACIWFPDEMGSLAYFRGLPMDETPGCLVVAGGWLLLLLPVICSLISYLRGG